MIVSSIHIKNIKSFENSDKIKFSKGINILVGPNNAGKSVIINALCHLQYRNYGGWYYKYFRIDSKFMHGKRYAISY